MLQELPIKQNGKNLIWVNPNYFNATYPYRKQTNYYYFNRKDFGIDPELNLHLVGYIMYNTYLTNNAWAFTSDLKSGKSRSYQTASSAGNIYDNVQVGVNGKQLGVDVNGDNITITFYEGSSNDLSARYVDLFLLFD